MFNEDDFIQLSALQHFVFCQRQCALIHIEQAWVENQFTAEGRIMHENPDEGLTEKRKDLKIARGMLLNSYELGLSGKADVVEFHKDVGGKWQAFPVEYKRGKPKADNCDKVQLCAQALCLEEMLNARITKGALFYGRTKRRLDVDFDASLRKETKDTIALVHDFIKNGKTPKPVYTSKCKSCSFLDLCMPKAMEKKTSVKKYLEESINAV